MLNKVQLIGNVGKQPEIKHLEHSAIANLSLATTEKWTDKKTGEKKEKTEWHRVTVFGENLVNVVDKYVNQGDRLYIEGQLQTRKYKDKEGQDRYSTEVVVQGFTGRLTLLSSPPGGHTPKVRESSQRAPEAPVEAPVLEDDAIPF